MDDVSKGARTCELITKWSRQGKFSCKHLPLFDFIPMDRVVIDTLHLFLRISDVLAQLLIQDLRIAECIEKNQKFQKGFDRTKYTHMAIYEQFVKCFRIPFQWKVCPIHLSLGI